MKLTTETQRHRENKKETISHEILYPNLFIVFSSLCLCASVVSSSAWAEGKIEYNRDVRPILAENCFACHGADSAARKADLRLDRREDAIKAEAIAPGDPEKSALIERIFSDDKAQVMPPRKTKKKLTAAQKETLKRWIAAGAEYEPHWSFIAPKRAAAACGQERRLGAQSDRSLHPRRIWRNAACSRRRGGSPHAGPPGQPRSDRPAAGAGRCGSVRQRQTARRLRAASSIKLLDSPHWGEHRARYWLDAARYADTHGIHFDNYREMWAYRDWVINAFNRNLTFDRFTIEQLAGDLLPNRTLDQQVASGFNRCNITSNEGGLIPEEYLVLYTRDRTETTARVWLGLTANCAVCHDHKFDPLSQKEFYSMSAFFNNTTQGAMDGNIKDTPPIVFVPRMEDRPRWDVVTKELAEARKQVETRKQTARADFDKWLASSKADAVAGADSERRTAFARRAERGQGRDHPPDGGRQAAHDGAGLRRRLGRRACRRRRPSSASRAARSKSPTPAISRSTRVSPTAPG